MIESSQSSRYQNTGLGYNNSPIASPYNRAAMSSYNHQGYDYDYGNQDDEPLENYLAVQDADNVQADKSYSAIPNEYYYTGWLRFIFISLVS